MLEQTQISVVLRFLESLALEPAIKAEVLDHYISAIESKMIAGLSFENAFNLTQQEFGSLEIEKVNRHKLNLIRMKRIKIWSLPLSACLVMLIALNINAINSSESWTSPIPSDQMIIQSSFGLRVHPIYKTKKMHNGIDLAAKLGTPVNPIASGLVICTGYSNVGHGNYLMIRHNDSIETKYSQLNTIAIEAGERVDAFDIIGTVGSSGVSTAPHLHFEVLKNNAYINPTALGLFETK